MTKNVFVNFVSLIMSAWINWIKDICVRVSPIYHIWLVRRLKKKKTINVVFFAASVSMWRYQRLYECMAKNPRFNTNIIILPASAYSESQQDADTSALMNFFNFTKQVEKARIYGVYNTITNSNVSLKKQIGLNIEIDKESVILYESAN